MTMATAIITSGGRAIPDRFNLLSLETTKVANKIPYAQLVVQDGNGAAQDFAISGSDWFAPGTELEITLRDEAASQEQKVFQGLVTSQNIQANGTGSLLIVEVKDSCIRLDGERRNAVYNQQSLTQVIDTILQRNRVQAGDIQASSEVVQQLVQYQSSDWDFLMMRADVNQLVVMVDDGVLSAKTVSLSGPAQHQFTYGISPCLSFDMNASVSQQYAQINASDWDIQTQYVAPEAVAEDIELSQGSDVSLSAIAKDFQRTQNSLQSMTTNSEPDLQAWANSGMQKDRLSMFRGTITLAGSGDYTTGEMLDIQGVGGLFSGNTLITGVSHCVNKNGWQTILQFGLSARWYAEQYPHISALPASGLLPNVSGLQIGIVEYFEPDPEREFHLQVRIPALKNPDNPQGDIVWARLSAIYAGKAKGLFFVPDPGDEVIVGFINDDPRNAIILGAAYSQLNNPPQGYDFDSQNQHQGIVTPGNLQLSFNDEQSAVALQVPAQKTQQGEDNQQQEDQDLNKLQLQTGKGISILDQFQNQMQLSEQGIAFKDQFGNSIVMSEKGIEIISVGDIQVKADKGAQLEAKNNMKLQAAMIDLN